MKNNKSLSIENSLGNFKKILSDKIIEEVKSRDFTHSYVAELIRCSRPKITRLVNGNLEKISMEFLMKVLCALGIQMEVQFAPIANQNEECVIDSSHESNDRDPGNF